MGQSSLKPTSPILDRRLGYKKASFFLCPKEFSSDLDLLLEKLNLLVTSLRVGSGTRFEQLAREIFTLSIIDHHEGLTVLFYVYNLSFFSYGLSI